jgi:hypothetical protein
MARSDAGGAAGSSDAATQAHVTQLRTRRMPRGSSAQLRSLLLLRTQARERAKAAQQRRTAVQWQRVPAQTPRLTDSAATRVRRPPCCIEQRRQHSSFAADQASPACALGLCCLFRSLSLLLPHAACARSWRVLSASARGWLALAARPSCASAFRRAALLCSSSGGVTYQARRARRLRRAVRAHAQMRCRCVLSGVARCHAALP